MCLTQDHFHYLAWKLCHFFSVRFKVWFTKASQHFLFARTWDLMSLTVVPDFVAYKPACSLCGQNSYIKMLSESWRNKIWAKRRWVLLSCVLFLDADGSSAASCVHRWNRQTSLAAAHISCFWLMWTEWETWWQNYKEHSLLVSELKQRSSVREDVPLCNSAAQSEASSPNRRQLMSHSPVKQLLISDQ